MAQENKIYVGNLSYSTTEEEIKKLFNDNGIETKTVTLIIDKYTGKSKGFGFVEVESDEVLQKAVETLSNYELDGRKLTVNKAKPLQPRSNRFSGGRDGGRSRF